MSEDTTLAILSMEMYKHFGSVESRKHLLITFVYAFLLGSAANFAAGFIAASIGTENSWLLSLISIGILFSMVVFLLRRQNIILGTPSGFSQRILVKKKNQNIEKEVSAIVSSVLKNKTSSRVSIEEKTNKVQFKKKGILLWKELCTIECRSTTDLGGSVEVTLAYCNDVQGEEFSEKFLNEFYLEIRKSGYSVFIDHDARPFGKLLLQSRFNMLEKLVKELEG